MVTESRCPGCRARMAESPVCARCGCDLTLVRGAEAQAGRLVEEALRAWVEGDRERARSHARAALTLDRSPLAQALLRV